MIEVRKLQFAIQPRYCKALVNGSFVLIVILLAFCRVPVLFLYSNVGKIPLDES